MAHFLLQSYSFERLFASVLPLKSGSDLIQMIGEALGSFFLMFSPLSSRHLQPVFRHLCLGIFCLAITDGLLGYFSLSPSGFNTGTLQDILWPLSMLLLGLAAIEYPRCERYLPWYILKGCFCKKDVLSCRRKSIIYGLHLKRPRCERSGKRTWR